MDIQGYLVHEGEGERIEFRVWKDADGNLVLHHCSLATSDDEWLNCPLCPRSTTANGHAHDELHREANCISITTGDRPPLPPAEVARKLQKLHSQTRTGG